MPVRKTESKLPFDLSAEDLGQHISSAAGSSILVGFLSGPIVIERSQDFVVFVTDSGLASQVSSYHWQIENGTTTANENTDVGYFQYAPTEEGNLNVTVELKSSSNATLVTLNLQQQVIALNTELEALFTREDTNAPMAGHPETSRELINDFRAYIDAVAPRDEDADSTSNSLLFSIIYNEVLSQPSRIRIRNLERIANSLNEDDKTELLYHAENGIGLCQIRPQILAMYLEDSGSPIIDKVVLPEDEIQRSEANKTLLEELGNLSVDILIDMFNVLRFPKSHITMCKLLLDELKDEFNAGQSYQAVFSDKDTGKELIKQYKIGPVIIS